jgi:hypothetical protein
MYNASCTEDFFAKNVYPANWPGGKKPLQTRSVVVITGDGEGCRYDDEKHHRGLRGEEVRSDYDVLPPVGRNSLLHCPPQLDEGFGKSTKLLVETYLRKKKVGKVGTSCVLYAHIKCTTCTHHVLHAHRKKQSFRRLPLRGVREERH